MSGCAMRHACPVVMRHCVFDEGLGAAGSPSLREPLTGRVVRESCAGRVHLSGSSMRSDVREIFWKLGVGI